MDSSSNETITCRFSLTRFLTECAVSQDEVRTFSSQVGKVLLLNS